MGYQVPYISKDFVIHGSEIDIRRSLDDIWDGLDKRVRTSIRKGQKLAVQIRPYAEADLGMVRAITPNDDDIPALFTSRYHSYLAETVEGVFLGWILFVEIPYTKRVFMLCHASTLEGKKLQAPNLLLWHALSSAKELGFFYFDVGASYRPTLQAYFSGYREQSYPLILRAPELPIDLRITPFDTTAYGEELGTEEAGRAFVSSLVSGEDWTFVPRGAFAIEVCLRELRDRGHLTEQDEVCVATTTDTPYISSCVTQAIERVCRWSQAVSERTRAVLLIHEFGFLNPRAAEWKDFCVRLGIPLIEDMAYGLGSEGVGTWGDYKILSFTKTFPVPFGGALAGMHVSHERLWKVHGCSDVGKERDVLRYLARAESLEAIRLKRQEIWRLYEKHISTIGAAYFSLNEGVLPGAFLLSVGNESLAKEISSFINDFGVEVGSWYHHGALFLPCHQRMTERHVEYVCGVIRACYREGCGIPGKH